VQNEGETIATGVPESIIPLVVRQLGQLTSAERGVVEAASVAGREFSAEAIAVGLGQEVAHIEEMIERLVRSSRFFQVIGGEVILDRRKTARYSFIHSFFRDVIYAQLMVGQRVVLNQHIGAWKEEVFGERGEAFAEELAVHFEQGQDYRKAWHYRWQAAQAAVQDRAPREAVRHLDRGLAILKTLPDTPERSQQELELRTLLESLLATTKGYLATEMVSAYTPVQELCKLIEEVLSEST